MKTCEIIRAILGSKSRIPTFRQNGEFCVRMLEDLQKLSDEKEDSCAQELLEPGPQNYLFNSYRFAWRFYLFLWRLTSSTCQKPKRIPTPNFHVHYFANRES